MWRERAACNRAGADFARNNSAALLTGRDIYRPVAARQIPPVCTPHAGPEGTGDVVRTFGHDREDLSGAEKRAFSQHAAVVFDLGGENFIYEDTRYFGRLTLDNSAIGKLGPEPLGKDFPSAWRLRRY